jgi:hypothetical protein
LNTVNSIINELQGKKAWWYLLINLNPVLQLDLLNTMITANRFPTDRDWLNIFQVTHYQFKTGWHYQISLMFSAILSLLAVIGIWEVALTQKEAALIMLNGLIVAVITTFWLVMAYESWEPNLFINSGVFGVKLYYNELSQFLKNSSASYFVNIITKLYRFKGHQKGANSFMTALVLALSGILWIVLFVYSFKPLEMNVFVAAASILVLLINIIHLISDKQNDISYSFVLILFTIAITVNSGNIISAVEIWIVSALSILGIACWYSIDNKIEKPWVKPCAVFALPWFCTAPFVLVFAGVELTFLLTPTNFLPTSPWQTAGLIELFFVGLIILVWQRGQKLDRMARNPLQGGLIEKMLREKYYRSNVSR